jgi:hypothetical protein
MWKRFSIHVSRDKWWIVANLFGATIYTLLASLTWIEPELRGEEVARAGAAIVWASSALPVLIAFVVADLVWFVRRAEQQLSLGPAFLCALLWVLVLGVNRMLS